MTLAYLENMDNFYDGLKTLFLSLNIPVNYVDEKPIKPQDILDKTYKDNDTFQLMNDVYFLGMVDDAAFSKERGSNLSEIKKAEKDYDGILIFGVTLNARDNNLLPTRTQLADITRAFNREFYYTPVTVVFRYENHISLANAERLKYKQEWREGEKAGKVSILRDIDIRDTHTGHIKILDELNIKGKKLKTKVKGKNKTENIDTFLSLYRYWQEVFSVSLLSKSFYTELSNWYFWAIKHVTFPSETNDANDKEKNKEDRAKNVIRLLTRLLFVWFIKEKRLIPEELFDADYLQKSVLKNVDFNSSKHQLFSDENQESIYYKAILQNLFFATLNCPISSEGTDKRKRDFRKDKSYGTHRGVDYLMRYKKYFREPETFLNMVNETVPFLNGGLFECLDDKDSKVYIDGFSDNMTKGNILVVPDYLFFGKEEKVDLSTDYGVKNKGTKEAAVKGLINILKSYKFTIAENTPIEEDVALDPELLGKVFENLLASYNPETKTTARKQSGSFYTPREIVNYMVDESLITHLKNTVSWDQELNKKKLDTDLHQLLSFDEGNPFSEEQSQHIIASLDACKILDPACGSGAFPMGILQKMVHILQKVDPDNSSWKNLQKRNAQEAAQKAFDIDDKEDRKLLLRAIDDAFDKNINDPDYARKLFLIENCIYGVDIQPIATQISKLRFFISLVVEQKVDPQKDNFGIRPLPNLETRFVTANTLIGLEKPDNQKSLFATEGIRKIEKELKYNHQKLFTAKTPKTKKNCRDKDKNLRNKISDHLKLSGWSDKAAEQLSSWNPFDQNGVSSFFDIEWMFDVKDGFDIVIGNPPYGLINKKQNKTEGIVVSDIDKKHYAESDFYHIARGGMINIYRLFIYHNIQILKKSGILCEIFPLQFIGGVGEKKLREYILKEKKINFIEAFPERDDPNKRVFRAVKMSVCIMLIENAKCDQKFSIRINRNNTVDITNEKLEMSYDLVKNIDKNHCSIPLLSPIELNIISLLFKKTKPFSEYGKCRTGEIDMTFGKPFFTDITTNPPLLKGAIIGRYEKKQKMSQGDIVFLDESPLLQKFPSKVNLKNKKRIVLQGITGVNEKRRLKMMIVSNAYAANSLNFLELIDDKNIDIILLLFNSKLLNFVFSRFSTDSNVNGYEVDNLPISNFLFSINILKPLSRLALFTKPLKEPSLFHLIDEIIDAIVFELYFSDHMKEHKIDIIQFVEKDIQELLKHKNFEVFTENEKNKVIKELHKRWSDPNSEIVKRINSFPIKSPNILKPILEN